MELLLTDPSQGVWRTPGDIGERRTLHCSFPWPCAPCASETCLAVACKASRECVTLEKATGRELCRMPCAPGTETMCLSPCGRYVYQLSSEADCVHTRCVATGELLFAAPAGVFPRNMCLEETGRFLLVPGGAVNETYLLSLPDLRMERTVYTRHPCFAAGFYADGLVLVCAVEGDDIHTAVYGLPPHALRPRLLMELPGQPGSLCVCPDGRSALLSTREGLMKLNLLQNAVLWNRPEWALCMRLSCQGNLALISAALDGRVCLLSHKSPWRQRVIACGTAAEACFCV